MQAEAIQQRLALPSSRSWQIEIQDEVTSTNALLKQRALQGAPEGSVLIARRQSQGKGRLGRSFHSPEETGLYMSLLLRPQLKVADSLLITTAAATAVARAIEEVTGVVTGIKWVNDIYCRNKKVVGILTEGGMQHDGSQEGEASSARLAYAVLGIGINVWSPKEGFPEELQAVAGSVLDRPRRDTEADLREELAAAVLQNFAELYPVLQEKRFMQEYRQRSLLIGQKVALLDAAHNPIPGQDPVTVVDIGQEAQLIVREADGRLRELTTGDVSVRLG